ncbi:winged helix-turn-helix domain-containing protein [Demequina muriae]|uniref:Crosslink repair DNA glycosylase YcaQ family protein n=1 Tax=Demequina muriae TaxID=3051664 RepID=A0ABT8GH80_9MICO|nr:crosslink repair DNA glycosylase YcaQ family protein [Demequina sp. EGI L300058]MDN4480797.1 crosslink repair DNA glycosylase YcaQ family protein [Demequina sp. EGI L300058]
MTLQLSAAEARRVFLDAQGLARRTPSRRARASDFDRYLNRQGVLQLDTVNVLARAHYLPLYSRLGAYAPADLDAYLWGDERGHSAHAFEHWGHEASVMPRDMLPLLHHRMVGASNWKVRRRDQLEAERPGLLDAVRAAVDAHGPVVASDLEHLAPRAEARGSWWDHGHVKEALEYLFITGAVAASRGRHFTRTYDAPMRGWGLSAAEEGEWGVPAGEARQALFDRALSATGIGTVKDLCDHFRLPYAAGARTPDVAGGAVWAASAVERGLAAWTQVEGWDAPALIAVDGSASAPPGHRAARDPGRATGRALLSPFDPVCWYRPRLLRMFGVDYRIEIYTPAPKRVYGYYCLPLLVGDRIVGRLDLKADRQAGVLRVQAAWHEPGRAPGSRALSRGVVAEAAAAELDAMAGWLGLDTWTVTGMGDLAPAL